MVDLSLTATDAAAIAGAPAGEAVNVELLRRQNHTWKITCMDNTYFLKAHTKDWYGDQAEAAQDATQHEVTGHRLLQEAGLPTAHVAGYSTTCDNPPGWP